MQIILRIMAIVALVVGVLMGVLGHDILCRPVSEYGDSLLVVAVVQLLVSVILWLVSYSHFSNSRTD